MPRPDALTFFTKSPDTVIGPFDDIACDERISRNGDYRRAMRSLSGTRASANSGIV